MEEYIRNYDNFSRSIVYTFNIGWGGLGDYIKFFLYTLTLCIKYNYKLYYLTHDIQIEKYIKLKYKRMMVRTNDIENLDNIHKVTDFLHNCNIMTNTIPDFNNYIKSGNGNSVLMPALFYKIFNYNDISINGHDVFEFSDIVKINSINLFSKNIENYISIHLRLGDKYLETCDPKLKDQNERDIRKYDENELFDIIEKNYNKNIIFFCDNYKYKLKIKNKYNKIFITDCNIGHTSYPTTQDKEVLDTITEFYLMTNSVKIFAISNSGFSICASKFGNIPIQICQLSWH